MKSYGAVAANYGVSIQDAVAMITGANEAIQDPARVGNGLKTVSLRLAGLKTSAKDGSISLNKTAKALESIAGITIFEDKEKTKVKDMFQILNEVSEVYGSLNEKEQLGLGEALGGAQQAAVVQSLLGNWKQVLKFKEQYEQGDVVGSTDRENALFMDSIEGRINVLKENLRSLVTDTMSTDMFKGLVDGASSFAGALNNVISGFGKLGMSTPVVVGIMGTLFTTIKGLGTETKHIPNLLTGTFAALKSGSGVATTALSSLGSIAAGIGTTLLNGLAIAAVVAGFVAIAKAIDNTVNKYKKLREEAKQNLAVQQEEISTLQESKKNLQELSSEYDTLSKNKDRTEEQTERLVELTGELAELYPELVSGYDEDGIPIVDLNNLDSALAKIDEAIAKTERLARQSEIEAGNAAIEQRKKDLEKEKKNKENVYERGSLGQQQELQKSQLKKAQELLSIEKEMEKVYNSKSWEKRKDALNNLQKAYENNSKELEKTFSDSEAAYQTSLESIQDGQTGVYKTMLNRNDQLTAAQQKFGQELVKGFDFGQLEFFSEDSVNTFTNALGKGLKDLDFDESGNPILNGSVLESINGITQAQIKLQETGNLAEYTKEIEAFVPAFAKFVGVEESVARAMLQGNEHFATVQNAMDAYMQTFGKTVGNTDEQAQKLKQSYEEIASAREILFNSANQMEDEFGEIVLKNEVVREFIEDENAPEKLQSLMNKFNSDGSVNKSEIDIITYINQRMEEGKGSITVQDYLKLQSRVNANSAQNGTNTFDVSVFLEPEYIVEDMQNMFKVFDDLGLEEEKTIKIKTAFAQGDFENLSKQLEGLDSEKKIEIIADAAAAMVELGILQDSKVEDKIFGIFANDNEARAAINEYNAIKNKTVTVTIKAKYGNIATYKAMKEEGFVRSVQTPPLTGGQPIDTDLPTTIAGEIQSDNLEVQEGLRSGTGFSSPVSYGIGSAIRASVFSPVDKNKVFPTFDNGVNLLKNIEMALSKISNELDIVDQKMKNAFGLNKQRLLEQQIKLYTQQQQLQHELAEGMRVQANEYRYYLQQKGVKFDSDGTVLNYSEKLLEVEKKLASLNSDSDNKEKNEGKIKELEKTKDVLEEYISLTLDKIPTASEEWWKLQNNIGSAKEELENIAVDKIDRKIEVATEEELMGLLEEKKKLLRELADRKKEYLDLLIKQGASEQAIDDATYEWKKQEAAIRDVEEELRNAKEEAERFAKDVSSAVKQATQDILKVSQELAQTKININRLQIDLLDKNMQLASFDVTGSYETLEKKIQLLEKEIILQNQLTKEYEKQLSYYRDNLIGVGIEFDSSGMATNVEQVLEQIKSQMANASSEEELSNLKEKFSEIVSILGDYNSALENVNNQQSNLVDIQLEIQGAYEGMLETTKKIEDKITAILQKQVEERKKLIQEELNKRLDALSKEQKAYNDKRKKDEYDKNYEEKLKEMAELQAKIDAVSKDTSLSGQAKLAELLKELAQKQEELDDMVQDKLDEDVNNRFDEEKEKLEEEAKKAEEELDKKLEKEELYDTIKDALETGKIKDIDGNLIDLKEAIMDYEDRYGDGLSIIGGLIKKDLLSQLDISLDTMKNIEEILKKLNIKDLTAKATYVQAYPVSKYQSVETAPAINFNESLITVQGNVTKDVIPELKHMIKQAEIQITKNIIKSM